MREGGWPDWVAVALAMVSAGLVIADFVLSQHNRALQVEVNQRQQFINESDPKHAGVGATGFAAFQLMQGQRILLAIVIAA